jgi:VanZ family protein
MNPFVLYSRVPRWVDLFILAIALGVVWLGSSIPPDEFPDMSLFSYDKVLHLLEYTCLGGAIWIAGRRHGLVRLQERMKSPLLADILGVVLPGALWAASDELHQHFVGRDCDLLDWLADLCGLLLAVALTRLLERRWGTPEACP